MFTEFDSKEDTRYQEITGDIKEKGYYFLPAGSVIDVKITTGTPTEIPIPDINNNQTGKIAESYDNIDTKQLNQFQIRQELMLGDVVSHDFTTGETELTITSPELVKLEKRRNGWYANLAKRYRTPDDYIDEEHEEKNTGSVDISLYIKDYPEIADEILEEERSLTIERDRLQREAEIKFLKTYGISIPEDKTLLKVSAVIKS